MAAYYRRRTESGVGLIIAEATGIERASSVNEPNVPLFYGNAALAGWKHVADEVHAAGGRIMPQLWHVGQKRSNAYRNWNPAAPYESPSGLSLSGEKIGHPMTDTDIANTIDAFAKAAAQAELLGFDGVEVHGGHNYLINQFFDEDLNRRTDEYGGATLLERSRFAVEVLRAIRRVVSPKFPVVLRLSQWKPKDIHARMAPTPNILETFLRVLIDAGADTLHLSQPRFSDAAFPECDATLNFAGWAKKLTGITCITVGSVGLSGDAYATFAGHTASPAPLDQMLTQLEQGHYDLVAVGRALLEDPNWLIKIRDNDVASLRSVTPDSLTRLH